MTSSVELDGIPETMLWVLYNRANEARRPDTYLHDPNCVCVYESIDYDFERSFGKPHSGHPMRSKLFDDALRPWLATHPGGTVVELGAGLETQFQRCDDGEVEWLCVDVPDAIAVRERFLPATPRCRFVQCSVLDLAWLDEVSPAQGVFVTAQGLFMYLTEPEVRDVVTAIVHRFPRADLTFDTVPRWFSQKTIRGYALTSHFTVPPMPWGVDRRNVESLLRTWCPGIASVELASYGFPERGIVAPAAGVMHRTPVLRDLVGTIVHIRI
jgi:O-methyltransferase involved in polyketide biosynthesis